MQEDDTSTWIDDDDELLSRLKMVRDISLSAQLPTLSSYSGLVELGRGGQGVVYSGVQESTNRRVAIKLLHHGALTDARALSRFEREIELVARLRHPNIVRLYDSGVSPDGRPFLVMDLVEGVSLDEYLAPLSGDQRSNECVRLIRDVARAVEHAHQRGVIHRDLKPSNIRVTPDGVPIIIDFGLAKSLCGDLPPRHSVTGSGLQFIGSLRWASPEQAKGELAEIDTRSDVYGLGLLVYFGIAGVMPYEVESSIPDVLHQIVGGQPVSLRQQVTGISRDLDRLVSRCLEKDRANRYQFAGDLADELDRVQAGEPILGTGDSAWKALRRRTKRYRVALAATAALLIVSIAFTASSVAMLLRTQAAERSAETEARRADAVNEFLTGMLSSAAPDDLGREVTVREVIERAEENLLAADTLMPSVRAELHRTVSETYGSLGDYERALIHIMAAIGIDEINSGSEHSLELENIRVGLLLDLSRYDEAESLAVELKQQSSSRLGDGHPVTLNATGNLALLASERGRFDEAIRLHEDLHRIRAREFGQDHETTLTSLHNIAVEENLAGRPERAMDRYSEVVRLQTKKYGIDHPSTIQSRNGLAVSKHNTGDLRGAAADFESLVPAADRVLGSDHPETNTIQSNYAFLLRDLDRVDEALALMERVYESTLRTLGPSHATTVNNRTGVAVMRYYLGDLEGAVELLEESYLISKDTLGLQDGRTIAAGKSWAAALRTAGRPDEALPIASEILEASRDFFVDAGPDLSDAIRLKAGILSDLGKLPAAVLLYEEIAELAADREAMEEAVDAQVRVAEIWSELGETTAAIAAYAQAISTAEVTHDAESERVKELRDRQSMLQHVGD